MTTKPSAIFIKRKAKQIAVLSHNRKDKNQTGKSSGSAVPPQPRQNGRRAMFHEESHNAEGKRSKRTCIDGERRRVPDGMVQHCRFSPNRAVDATQSQSKPRQGFSSRSMWIVTRACKDEGIRRVNTSLKRKEPS